MPFSVSPIRRQLVIARPVVEEHAEQTPGLIEGASQGVGLGIRFLKHIARTTSLVFLIDLASDDYLSAFPTLLRELEAFGGGLENKRRILVGTKTDLEESAGRTAELMARYPEEEIMEISAFARTGLEELRRRLFALSVEERNAKDGR